MQYNTIRLVAVLSLWKATTQGRDEPTSNRHDIPTEFLRTVKPWFNIGLRLSPAGRTWRVLDRYPRREVGLGNELSSLKLMIPTPIPRTGTEVNVIL